MLTYTGIFLASLVTALLARYFVKALTNKSGMLRAYQNQIAITDHSTKYEKAMVGINTCNGVPVPSLQQSRIVAMNLSKTAPAKPGFVRNPEASWLVQEKILASMGRSYKVRRRVEPVPLTLEKASQPFRREVAPWAQNNKMATRPWKVS